VWEGQETGKEGKKVGRRLSNINMYNIHYVISKASVNVTKSGSLQDGSLHVTEKQEGDE
jgi:hypothetical protein